MKGDARSDLPRWMLIGQRIERAFLAILAAALVLLALLQVILRNFFQTGWSWAEPMLGLGLLWLTMLGALAASGSGRHISMDALSHFLPKKARGGLVRAQSLFAAAVCALLTFASWRFVTFQRELLTHRLLGLPEWIYYLVLPIGFGLMTLRFLIRTGCPRRWLSSPAEESV